MSSLKSLSCSLVFLLFSLVLDVILILNVTMQLWVKSLELILSLLLDFKHPSLILSLLLKFNLLKLPLKSSLELIKFWLLHSPDSVFSLHHQSLKVFLLTDVFLFWLQHLVTVVKVLLFLLNLLSKGVYLDLFKSASFFLSCSELHELKFKIFLVRKRSDSLLLVFLKVNRSLKIILLCLQLKQLSPIGLLKKHLLLLHQLSSLSLFFIINHQILWLYLLPELILSHHEVFLQMSQLSLLL